MAARQSASIVSPRPLPARPNLENLKNQAKRRLKELRRNDPRARLAAAQLAVARAHGFSSWRALKVHLDRLAGRIDALVEAVKRGDIASLRNILSDNPEMANAAVEDRTTRILPTDTKAMRLLHVAVAENQPNVARVLLERGADPNVRNADGRTPLHDCYELSPIRDAIRQLLLEHGAEIDAALAAVASMPDRLIELLDRDLSLVNDRTTNLSPIAWATVGCSLDTVRVLLDRGAEIDKPPYRIEIAWALTATAPADVLRELLARGFDRDYRFDDGDTLLHRAIRNSGTEQLLEFTQVLLDAGLDVNTTNAAGQTALDVAIAADGKDVVAHATRQPVGTKRYAELIALLRKRARQPQSHKTPSAKLALKSRKSDWKPIMDAAFRGDVERVRKLLDAGADPNVVSGTAHRYRPLHRAIERKKTLPRDERHEAVVKLLLERGADPKLRAGHERLTALQLAAIGETRFVPMLLEHFRPLDIFHACVVGDEKWVAALLKKDPSLASARDAAGGRGPSGRNQWQALHYCAASRMFAAKPQAAAALVRIARMLLDAGADPMGSRLFDEQWPLRPLYDACGRSNNAAVAEVLLAAGADPCDGESVYHAADEGHGECLALIERYVDAEKLAGECTQCLRTQMRGGFTRGMKWLLAHGADPNAPGEELGNTALHWAAKNGASAPVIEMLLQHGADASIRNKAGQTPLDLARAAGKRRVVQHMSQVIGRTA